MTSCDARVWAGMALGAFALLVVLVTWRVARIVLGGRERGG